MSKQPRSDRERRAELKIARKVWDGLEDEQKRQDFSHYQGVGRFAQDADWRGIGEASFATLRELVADSFWDRAQTALEWGPGGGSNLFALSSQVSHLYGVDISEKNLSECARVLGDAGFTAIHLEDDLSQVRDAVTRPIDIFISTAVFQHFPSQAFGSDVLGLMADLMAPGAVGLVQIRYDNGAPKYRPNRGLDEYPDRFITATSYGIDSFASLLQSHGFCRITARDFNAKINYVTFGFQKP